MWIVPVNGGRSHRITTSPQDQELDISWSPADGALAYWSGCQPATACDGAIWMVDADGSDRRQVIAGASHPVWSNDGEHVAFSRSVRGDALHLDVWVADADGSHDRRVTTAPGEDSAVRWSSDDAVLMTLHWPPSENGDAASELDAVAVDGGGVARLADQASWGDWAKAR